MLAIIIWSLLFLQSVENIFFWPKCLHDFKTEESKLLIILVDGFRWDYIFRTNDLKGFPRIIENGVHAKHVKPVFPVKSHPNWYSITTGLYPENHGIMQNHMYDRHTNELFLLGPDENKTHSHWWNRTEPLWINAEKHGIKTSMYVWDGCQVTINGSKASFCYENKGYFFIQDFESADRITRLCLKKILDDFSQNNYRLSFLYYELIDELGHKYGPISENVTKGVQQIDAILNDLFDDIIKLKLDETLNVVVLSDHGMTDLSGFKRVFLNETVDFQNVELMLGWGSGSQILPKPDKEEEIYNQLLKINEIVVYKKEDIPQHFHYKNGDNVLPLLVLAKFGNHMHPPNLTEDKLIPQPKLGGSDDLNPLSGGNHGYNRELSDMHTIMYAFGPAFKKNFRSEPIENLDYYNLFCHILGIPAHPNNGSFDRVKVFLKDY